MDVKLLPHQYEVLSDTTTKIIGLVGGYGNGKTYTACRKAMQLSQLNLGFTGIVTEPTFPLLRDIFVPEMKEALKEWGIEYNFNASSYIFTLFINNQESKILCMSAENTERLVGVNAAWVLMDEFDTSKEEIAMKAFNKLLGRLRAGNIRQFIIFTTPEGFRATYRIFITENDGTRKIIYAKTSDNYHLPADFIETLKAQYPPALLEAYLNGHFVNLTSGSVYSYFDRKKHHSDREIREDDTLHIGQDFNYNGCCGAVHIIDNGIPILVEEYSTNDTHQIVNHLKTNYPKKKIIIYPDASGKANKTNSSETDIAILEKAGFLIDVPSKNPFVKNRVNCTNTLFYKNEYFINADKCPETVRAFEQQAYDKNGEPEKFGGAATIDDRTDSATYFIYRRFNIQSDEFFAGGFKR